MKVDWKGLMEGVRNKLVPPNQLKELVETTSAERMAICDACEWKRGKRCGKCGCFLDLKTKCLSCKCPIDKWTEVLSRDESLIVKESINVTPTSNSQHKDQGITIDISKA